MPKYEVEHQVKFIQEVEAINMDEALNIAKKLTYEDVKRPNYYIDIHTVRIKRIK